MTYGEFKNWLEQIYPSAGWSFGQRCNGEFPSPTIIYWAKGSLHGGTDIEIEYDETRARSIALAIQGMGETGTRISANLYPGDVWPSLQDTYAVLCELLGKAVA